MKNRILYAVWGGLFLICAGLGFVSEPAGWVRGILTAVSLLFFLPPALLLREADTQKKPQTAALIGNLAALSLGLTLVLLALNILSAFWSEQVGMFLHDLLTVVSAPMIASGCWVLSLFLWACLLLSSLAIRKKLR